MSYFVECSLPRGGTANLRPRLSHEAAVRRRTLAASLMPTRTVRKLQALTDTDRDMLDVLAESDVELATALEAQDRLETETIRLVVHDWDGITGPEGNALVFPGDVPRMDEADFDHLFKACEAAIAAGRADPNAGGRP